MAAGFVRRTMHFSDLALPGDRFLEESAFLKEAGDFLVLAENIPLSVMQRQKDARLTARVAPDEGFVRRAHLRSERL